MKLIGAENKDEKEGGNKEGQYKNKQKGGIIKNETKKATN
jgi:hypothetical protein